MLLHDIITHLKNGVLQDASLGLGSDLTDEQDNYNLLLPHINVALIQIHFVLPIKLSSVIIETHESINDYLLKDRFAISNTASPEPIKYIKDSVTDKFNNDCAKLSHILDENNNEINTEDTSLPDAVWFTGYNSFYVKTPITGKRIKVVYRANFKPLNLATLDPTKEDIELPPFALDAFSYLVASKVYGSTPSAQETYNKSAAFMNMYKNAINELKSEGLTSTNISMDKETFYKEGWV